jgi:hypothetical protein
MKILFAIFLVVHGLIHLMGTAKAFGIAEIPVKTISSSWKAEASITGRSLYHVPCRKASAEKWNTTGLNRGVNRALNVAASLRERLLHQTAGGISGASI